jgi:hypothetical protein
LLMSLETLLNEKLILGLSPYNNFSIVAVGLVKGLGKKKRLWYKFAESSKQLK